MKKVVLSALLVFFFFVASAQPAWTWLQGDALTPIYGRYGKKGVADTESQPGRRTGYATWKDAAGDIWLFGGEGFSSTGYGFLNDLWKYSPATDTWTWVSGDYVHDQPGVYGAKGVASPGNVIRSRASAISWMDAAGDLWLFGGQTFRTLGVPVSFYTNDLWKFAPATGVWTWMGGDTNYVRIASYPNVYGTRGVAAATNKPGSRYKATGWTDNAGDLWMFGGFGVTGGNFAGGYLNDLWKYSPASGLWTWMKGDTLSNQKGRYETKGVASATTKPGAKVGAASWIDTAGNCWLFSGSEADDVWSFSSATGQWTWISGDSTAVTTGRYGTRGVSSPANTPGSRSDAIGRINGGTDFFLYGGIKSGPLKDLWKFSTVTREWTWLGGDSTIGAKPGVYGLKGIPSDTTKPGSVIYGGGWMEGTNKIWLSNNNLLWNYSLATDQWTWVRGDTSTQNPYTITYPGSYGTKGVPSAANQPKPRRFAATWTDTSNTLWMYGGSSSPASTSLPVYYYNFFSDLWKYDPSSAQWTWVQGDSLLERSPVYGTQGVPAAANTPGARHMAASWTDADGSLWLFGGYYYSSGYEKRYADLWKYSPATGQWTWIKGDTLGNQSGRYETKGVATANTHPGGRYEATTWKDAAGNLWLFGGIAYGGNVLYYHNGRLNDLWKYTPSSNRWTWMGGDSATWVFCTTCSPPGIYGTKGVAAASNQPGGRSGASGWTDAQGNFWLFGGTVEVPNGSSATSIQYLNDLWKYEPARGLWTWMNGDNDNPARQLRIPRNVYGIKGVPAAANTPGGRKYATPWRDAAGNLYLFGGNLDSTSNFTQQTLPRNLSDFWRYSITDNQWTWLGGDTNINRNGIYGTPGQPSALNQPGARDGSMAWGDDKGNLWLYSGLGYPVNGTRFLNDIMKFSLSAALPVLFSSFYAQKQSGSVALRWSTAQEQNSHSFIIERSSDGIVFSAIGTVAAAGTTSAPSSYGFTDITPLPGDNYYRLKEVDLDDKFMYSSVAKIYFGDKAAGFTILNNPVQHDVQISLWLSSEQQVQLQIRDAGGRMLMARSFMAGKGANLLRLPVSSLSKGTYFIQVQSQQVNGTKPFVKQ